MNAGSVHTPVFQKECHPERGATLSLSKGSAESKDPYPERATAPPQGILTMQRKFWSAAFVEMPLRCINWRAFRGSFGSVATAASLRMTAL